MNRLGGFIARMTGWGKMPKGWDSEEDSPLDLREGRAVLTWINRAVGDKVFTCTNGLRWHNGVLEQTWYCVATGESFWEPVKVVE